MTIYWGDGTSASTAPTGSANEQRVKAWVAWNGQGTPSIHDSYRVSSVSDFQTGRYTVNWQDSHDGAYSVTTCCKVWTPGNTARTTSCAVWNSNDAISTNFAKFYTGWVGNNNSGSTDPPYISVHLCN